MTAPAASVEALRVELTSGEPVVEEISLAVRPGEIVALVGESGSGKTTVGMALLGYTRRGARVASGRVRVQDRDLIGLEPGALRELRGSVVSYIPQDPAAALNPAMRVRRQLLEVLEKDPAAWPRETLATRLKAVLQEVALPFDSGFLARYPHQLSGGQQQRVAIAMAFIAQPQVLVCDEPTTGLDVTTQNRVLETIVRLSKRHDVATLYVTHDLAVVSEIADRVVVMYAGRAVESGSRDAVFANPAHPYTHRLLAAAPDVSVVRSLRGIAGHAPAPGEWPSGCPFAPRCELAVEACREVAPALAPVAPDHLVACIRVDAARQFAIPPDNVIPLSASRADAPLLAANGIDAYYGDAHVVLDAALDLEASQCVAVVGESGSGKTTLARCIAGLHPSFGGEVVLRGERLSKSARTRPSDARKAIQYVFQSPYGSLNPRASIGQTIAQPLRIFFGLKGRSAVPRIAAALERVKLPASTADRYPDQLSGGERQRVAIARALAAEPAVLVCDEITSALDVSVQAAIVELLGELQRDSSLALLFITHNLALVHTIADRVIVMKDGRIVERDATSAIFESPKQPYTSQLLASTPSVHARDGRSAG